ncbi:MAG: thiolase family protein [Acidobacteria bacterium]|nr:thiolase family protein [Acidobacteriota bacterium]
MSRAYIPYGGYWSTPFVRWQGSFANLNAIPFAAEVAVRALRERQISPGAFDALCLGISVPQRHSFYGAPWLAGLMGMPGLTGPTIMQACATSARVIAAAAAEVETGVARSVLTITCDRCSNGPHVFYPNPLGPGGKGDAEDWVWDNFGFDPYAKNSMLQTAENVAREAGITTAEQHELTLLRYSQYQAALEGAAAFHKRYMVTPLEVKDPAGRRVMAKVEDDEGIFPTTTEGLAKLKPLQGGGTVTFGGQTFPADGNCGLIVCTRDQARALGRDKVEVQVLAFAQARVRQGFMPQATVPAARQALDRAGVALDGVTAIKTHNPFAVNDIYFSREMGVPKEAMNNYGSSLIWGHPQAPTGMRLIIELIEELVLRGGGHGLFVGCAAGDTAAAVVIKVG